MEISKAQWTSIGNDVKLSMPIAKIDQEKRTVSGFATLDNIDRQGDIVPAEASLKAFGKFRGNLREMHQSIAVGKVVSFKEDSYFDSDTKKFYNGVYVSAYVSKGAQDTWEKVLDGTLTGFSIGGTVKDYEDKYDDNIDKSVRVIKDYELYELSLVDNPANQYANVLSIEKGHTGGYLAKALIENVFWCNEDDIVQLSSGAFSDCPRCDKGMQNIGFVESNDVDKADVVKGILTAVKNEEEKEVSKMEETIETPVEEVEVEKAIDATAEATETAEAEVEKAADAPVEKEMSSEDDMKEEEDMEDEEEMKAVGPGGKGYDENLEATKAMSEELASTITILADTVKSLNQKIEELHKTVAGVSNEVSEVKGNFDEFGKRVDAVEKDTAFRKSGDLGEIVQEEPTMVRKSLWGGRFLTKSDLFN